MLTNSSQGNLMCSKEEKVVTLLHASNDSISIKILSNGFCQPFIVSFCKVNSASIFITHIFKTLHTNKKNNDYYLAIVNTQ